MSRDTQAPLPGAEGIRDDELEKDGVLLVNAKNAKIAAQDAYKAAYAAVKKTMREKDIESYPMLDAPGVTLVRKHRDDEIKIEETDAAAVK
jgi:hypothetical protein